MVISRQGRVFAWGQGSVGQTGLGMKETVNVPHCIEALEGRHVRQVQQPSQLTAMAPPGQHLAFATACATAGATRATAHTEVLQHKLNCGLGSHVNLPTRCVISSHTHLSKSGVCEFEVEASGPNSWTIVETLVQAKALFTCTSAIWPTCKPPASDMNPIR